MAKVIGTVTNDQITAIKAHNLVVEQRLLKRHSTRPPSHNVTRTVGKRLIHRKRVIKPLTQTPFANLNTLLKENS